MTAAVLALAPALCPLYLLHGGVDNPPLIRVHRLERAVAAALDGLFRELFAQRFERLAALFAVAANVERNAVIRPALVVCNEPRQVLQRVERLAAVTDRNADVLARHDEHRAAALFFRLLTHRHLGVRQPERRQNLFQVFRRIFRRGGQHKSAHFRRASAENAQGLFHRQFQHFKLCLFHRDPQFFAGGLLCLFDSLADPNRFFFQSCLPPSFSA